MSVDVATAEAILGLPDGGFYQIPELCAALDLGVTVHASTFEQYEPSRFDLWCTSEKTGTADWTIAGRGGVLAFLRGYTAGCDRAMAVQSACLEELINLIGYLPEAQAILDKHGVQRVDTRQTPA